MSEQAVAVVGTRGHSTAHVHPSVARASARLVGVCDLVERAWANARRFGGTAYADRERMIEAEPPDGVVVRIGPEAHADLAPGDHGAGVRRLRRGTSRAGGRERAGGRPCGRADRPALCDRIREAVRPRLRGHPVVARGPPRAAGVAVGGLRVHELRRPDAFLLDSRIHAIDLVGYLGGPVAALRATAREEPAAYAVTPEFESGAVGTMALTDGRSFAVPTETVELTLAGGTSATVRHSSRWRRVEGEEPTGWHEPPTFVSGGEGDAGTGHVRELEAFVSGGEGDDREGRPRSPVARSYRSTVRYEAIAEAAHGRAGRRRAGAVDRLACHEVPRRSKPGAPVPTPRRGDDRINPSRTAACRSGRSRRTVHASPVGPDDPTAGRPNGRTG